MGDVDGLAAQRLLSPSGRPPPPEDEDPPRRGAALAYLFERDGSVWLPLTQRTVSLREHAGQVSLPGGRPDTGESLWDTAVREAWEEIGLPRDYPTKVGELTPVYIPVTHTLLHVFVATGPSLSDFAPPNAEVSKTEAIPVDQLIDERHREYRIERKNGAMRNIPYMKLGSFSVWGATSMALSELAVRFQSVLKDDDFE